jgi:hypothetical protein
MSPRPDQSKEAPSTPVGRSERPLRTLAHTAYRTLPQEGFRFGTEDSDSYPPPLLDDSPEVGVRRIKKNAKPARIDRTPFSSGTTKKIRNNAIKRVDDEAI